MFPWCGSVYEILKLGGSRSKRMIYSSLLGLFLNYLSYRMVTQAFLLDTWVSKYATNHKNHEKLCILICT